jgi:UDP-N-acetylmuramoyl-L-alanyl-D-glutamate--2,6-diaminopimelate ligase
MGRVAARLADQVIVTSDNPRSEPPEAIIDEVMAGIDPEVRADRVVDRAEAILAAITQARDGDIVVIAGKGHETYQIVGSERRHFDDREVVNGWIHGEWMDSRRRVTVNGA